MDKESQNPIITPDWRAERLAAIKQLYPDLFTDEGKINPIEIGALVANGNISLGEKFEFRWPGKMQAKKNAFTSSKARLSPDMERSVNFDETRNVIIEGENLEVLKLLSKAYYNKVKCIYIDPPYNTGHDFVYSDDYSEGKQAYWEKNGVFHDGVKVDTNAESAGRYHTNWLNMMTPRLLLAQMMLKDDGVIFVSIDDSEVHNLRKLMDEVFGEENFVGCISIVGNPRGRDYGGIARMHDYLVVYGKSEALEINNLSDAEKEFEFSDKIGGFDIRELRNRNIAFHSGNRPNLYYPFFINPDNKDENGFFEISLDKKPGWVELFPKESQGFQTVWRWGKPKSKENLNVNIVGKAMLDGGYQIVEKYREMTKMARSVWFDKDVNTEKGTLLVKDLFDAKVFPFPKPYEMIKRILEMGTNADSLVLDFFAGSGTTAHAVLELNKEDGGNRKFIMVQIPEATDEKSAAFKAGYKKISDITVERVKRAGVHIHTEKPEVDVGFKVFKLTTSIFPENTYQPDPEKSAEENVQALKEHIARAKQQLMFDPKGKETDLMYETLIKQGFMLTMTKERLKEFGKNEVWKVTDGDRSAIVCLDAELKDDTVKALARYKDNRFIGLHRAVDTTKKWELTQTFGEALVLI